jgi:hypothetical protein
LTRVLTKLDADQFDSLQIPACQRSASSDPLRQETPRMLSPLGSQRSFFNSTIHPQEARSIRWEVAAFCGRRPASVPLHFVSTEGFIPDDRGKTVTKPLH